MSFFYSVLVGCSHECKIGINGIVTLCQSHYTLCTTTVKVNLPYHDYHRDNSNHGDKVSIDL